jgi:hypothetical protein
MAVPVNQGGACFRGVGGATSYFSNYIIYYISDEENLPPPDLFRRAREYTEQTADATWGGSCFVPCLAVFSA